MNTLDVIIVFTYPILMFLMTSCLLYISYLANFYGYPPTGRNFNSTSSSSSSGSGSSSGSSSSTGSGSSSRARDNTQSVSQKILTQLNNILDAMKQLLSKAMAQVILFSRQLSEQQRTYIVVALLGVLLYFLFYPRNTSREGSFGGFGGGNGYFSRPYDMNRPDIRTEPTRKNTKASKRYNDASPRYGETDNSQYDNRGSERVHRSGNRYNKQDRRW